MSEPATRISAQKTKRPTSFSIDFGRRPKMIGLVRRFVEEFYGHLYDEIIPPLSQRPGWTTQVSLAAHELVENAVRHGREGDAVFSIIIEADPDEPDHAHLVRVVTRNRATPRQCERVIRRLDELSHADDLFAYYLGLMTESASSGEGLGLARIRVEAQMDLGYAIEGEQLEITARAHVSGRATPER